LSFKNNTDTNVRVFSTIQYRKNGVNYPVLKKSRCSNCSNWSGI